ncbi:hypothetical protein ABZ345_41290 [Lentzea sp. NPDC005914]|uniref:hypothetical protein n=1 Tax=Lentzea sp. NPDC005914 TaxID=3154572 RepID=UPI0033EA88A6
MESASEWPYQPVGDGFRTVGWEWIGGEVRERYVTGPLAAAGFGYLAEIIDSVLASGVRDRLWVSTAMHDLTIVPANVGQWESIFVVSPANYPLLRGHMGLAFWSEHRRWEYRQYKVEDAVEAFWEMVEEKFGITR